MTKPHPTRTGNRMGKSLIALACAALAGSTFAQEDPDKLDAVIVTGFRASLNSALNLKKNADGLVDVIKAEDMGVVLVIAARILFAERIVVLVRVPVSAADEVRVGRRHHRVVGQRPRGVV